MRGTKLFAFRATALDSHSSLPALPLDAGEHVITLVVEKKDKLNGQNFDGEANWPGCCKLSLYAKES